MKKALLATAAAVLLPVCAHATNYSFTQTFSEGAIFAGTFSGTDLDLDGHISTFNGEISAFSATFSGNSFVPALSFDFTDLYAIAFDLDGLSILGDGAFGSLEGIAVMDKSDSYGIDVGIGPAGYPCDGIGICGAIADEILGAGDTFFDTTIDQAIVSVEGISAVPLPAGAALMLGGLGMLMTQRRRAS